MSYFYHMLITLKEECKEPYDYSDLSESVLDVFLKDNDQIGYLDYGECVEGIFWNFGSWSASVLFQTEQELTEQELKNLTSWVVMDTCEGGIAYSFANEVGAEFDRWSVNAEYLSDITEQLNSAPDKNAFLFANGYKPCVYEAVFSLERPVEDIRSVRHVFSDECDTDNMVYTCGACESLLRVDWILDTPQSGRIRVEAENKLSENKLSSVTEYANYEQTEKGVLSERFTKAGIDMPVFADRPLSFREVPYVPPKKAGVHDFKATMPVKEPLTLTESDLLFEDDGLTL